MALGSALGFLGAGLSGGMQVLGAKSQTKAAKRAGEMALQTNRENNALAERLYDRNVAALSPWQGQGMQANNLFNSALGMPAPAAPAPSAFAPPGAAPGYNGAPMRGAFDRVMAMDDRGGEGMPYGYGASNGAPQGMVTTAAPSAPAATPMSAFDTFRNSTGYQFRMNEGLGAMQKAFGRSLDSGAAVKSALRFGQGLASDEFGKWMQLLDNQQRLGFGAASAQVGVNQNMASTLTGNNNAGSSAAINARLYQGNANAQMWNGIGSSFGQAAGMFMPGFGGR